MLAYQQNAKQNGEVFQMQKLVIKNIGQILSGKREEPLIEADCLVSVDGKIKTWGKESDLDLESATSVVDANGVKQEESVPKRVLKKIFGNAGYGYFIKEIEGQSRSRNTEG